MISPHAAARSTLGSGRHTITKPRVSAPPSTAVVLSRSPSAAASPRRSARAASRGGPVSRARTSVRLLPETAIRCSRSVARNASSRSGGTREVSPTTSPGSSARASAESPSVALRSPSRSRPARFWSALGAPVTRGGPPPSTRTTAAARSPSRSGGANRPCTRSRVEGSSASQRARSRSAPARTVISTGARVAVVVPSGPVIRPTSASTTTATGAGAAPRTRGRVSRGSAVISTSAVTPAYSRASSGTGPCRTSAACSAATAPAAAPHSSAAATAPAARPCHPAPRSPELAPRPPEPGRGARRRARSSSTPATRQATAQPTATVPPGVPRAMPAAAQAVRAGGTRRRSGGPSWRGSDAPRGEAAAAWTAARARVG